MLEEIRGKQKETWHHTNGCRLWLEVERSTITHEIITVKACHPQIDSITRKKTSLIKYFQRLGK